MGGSRQYILSCSLSWWGAHHERCQCHTDPVYEMNMSWARPALQPGCVTLPSVSGASNERAPAPTRPFGTQVLHGSGQVLMPHCHCNTPFCSKCPRGTRHRRQGQFRCHFGWCKRIWVWSWRDGKKAGARAGFVGVSGLRDLRVYRIGKDCLPAWGACHHYRHGYLVQTWHWGCFHLCLCGCSGFWLMTNGAGGWHKQVVMGVEHSIQCQQLRTEPTNKGALMVWLTDRFRWVWE